VTRRWGTGDAWTEELTSRVLELWSNGMSAAKIGLIVGKSRGSVIGRMHRIGAPTHGKGRTPNNDGPRPPRKAHRPPVKGRLARLPSQLPPGVVVQLAPPVEGGATLMELEDGMCRWPIAELRYCGGGTGGKRETYCVEHRGIGRIAPQPPRRKHG